ncbi:MAG TPA: sigma-70 family RNA polymerase sigma factor, partial [Polyangiaceae bacterium]
PLVDALPRAARLEVTGVYAQYCDFVWRTLQHLGARGADLEDLTQEVFVVVHRKLGSFDGNSRVTTWLFGICLRVVARHRRRAYFRFERQEEEPPERVDASTPEDRASTNERALLLERALEKLGLEHRAVFVLFEIEGHRCEDIAETLGVPVGTVYSRLFKARKHVAKALERASRSTRGGAP